MKLIGAALAAAVIVAGCATGLPSPASDASFTTGSETPTHGPSPSPTARPPVTSLPTQAPEPKLTGEFPGPGASVFPGAAVLLDLRLQDLAEVWASLRLSCDSHATGGPESPADYSVHCERTDSTAGVDVVADADYWTADGIVVMSVSVVPSGGESIDATAAATMWVFPFAKLAGGNAAVTWVQGHIEDPSCYQDCVEIVRGSQLAYASGTRGAQQLDYVAQIPSH
ncbi:MAG TPA: hypothetical protein VGM49_01755 [Candidatus Limnocylindrales bacterium]|jgi:hypothetical protein